MNDAQAQHSRRERLRALARDRDLDGILVYAWRRGTCCWFTGYIPGFATNYAALWQPAQGDPVLAVRFPFESERARRSGVRVAAGGSPLDLVPSSAKRLGLVGGDLAIDETPGWLRDGLHERRVEMADVAAEVDEWRAVKAEGDIADLRVAAEIGAAALESAGGSVVGESDFAIAARVEAAGRAAGAFRISCLIGVGDGAVVTEAHGRVVADGEPVGIELTLWAAGACMHLNDTIIPRAPKRHQLHAIAVCREARLAMLDALAPGTPVDEVVARGDGVLERYGLFEAKEYDFGHGLGCDTPEHPRMVLGTGRSIQAGNVLALHVAVRRPGAETAFVGGPVVVRELGAEELTAARQWRLAPANQ